jgi:hypothetical protein
MKATCWYASYGSNLLRSRFLCYLQGGQPEGASREYSGCTDRTPPTADKPIEIPHELYFSQSSSIWEDKAVAFIKSNRSEDAQTLGRMYLITLEQFTEVVRQENGFEADDRSIQINFDELIVQGETSIKPTWYGRIMYLGEEGGSPIFTFTARWDDELIESNAPGEKYLKTIMRGLKETYNLTDNELVKYFESKSGIHNNLSEEILKNYVSKL